MENKLYKMILIDDELFELKCLKNAIEWEKYGFEIAGVFKNGLSALEFIAENHVDAAISDIRMPIMDGLEFSSQISQRHPDIKVALLSAYHDFEYARKAIACNVVEYLMKPLRFEELSACVSSLKNKIDTNQKDIFFINSDKQNQFQKLFSDLFCGIIKDKDEIKEKLNKIGIYVDPSSVSCAIINLHAEDFDGYIKNIWKRGINQFYLAVSQLVPYETIFLYTSLFRYSSGNVEFALLSKSDKSTFTHAVEDTVSALAENARDVLKLKANVSVSEIFSSLIEIMEDKQTIMQFSEDPVDKAIHHIKSNYAKDISLEQVSAYVCLSPVYFSSLFKKKTGQSFIKYLTEYRIKKARNLLKNSNETITSICEAVGYKNLSHFYQLFKEKNNGLTPMEYRQNYFEKGGE